ncbi:hypothetical protein MIND_00536600 [Mycena indigotica]|uniref:Uncharacterized protein n=1 Tax=Mycena indigotica TaxID=2126181 RepID=A0A8H6SZZ7_9AGAR|nr:uncharacterized protein MIND_00536600 [Mycena indigotica]KAF7307422.1 hypothetical protein MIND_00536600 [Mycena indigotica]
MAGITFSPSKDIPSLSGRVILITGANTGLGKEYALNLVKHRPAEVWLTARDDAKGQAALSDVKGQASPETKVSLLNLDLSSFASVKATADAFIRSTTRLDILFLNAGMMGCPPAVSVDGYEIQFATNHLGHALLLKLLTPLLSKTAETVPAADVRVVSLSSVGYKHVTSGTIQFDTLQDAAKILDPNVVSPVQRYTQSKLANLLYAQEFAKRHPQFTTVSVDPGAVTTELFSREPGDEQMKMLQTVLAPKHGKPLVEGVKNPLWAATASSELVQSGKFYEPVGKEALEGAGLNTALAKTLWEWTEEELRKHS